MSTVITVPASLDDTTFETMLHDVAALPDDAKLVIDARHARFASPYGLIGMLTLVFSQFLETPAYGESFLLFFATGYLPFYFFISVSSQVGTGLSVNRELLQLPMVKPLDVILARFMLAFLTLLVV